MNSLRELLASVGEQLGSVRLPYVLAAVLLYSLSLLVWGARWRSILSGLGQRISLWDATAANVGSVFVANLTPTRIGGDVFRLAIARYRGRTALLPTTASLGYDRLGDLVPIVLLALLSLPTLSRLVGGGRGRWLLWGALLVVAVTGATLLLRRAERLRAWFTSLTQLRLPAPTIVATLAYSFLLWAMDLGRIYLLAASLGVWLSPLDVVPLSVLSVLGGLLSFAGIGLVEGGLSATLVLLGVPLAKAIPIALFERAMFNLYGSAVGGLAVLALGGTGLLRALRRGQTPDGEALDLAAEQPPTGSAPGASLPP